MQLPIFQSTLKDLMLMQTKWKSLLDPVIAAFSSGQGFIGEVRAAFLTEAQFQSQAGNGWVLCDGRTVTGSTYQTQTGNNTIPDCRGTVLRAQDGGRGLNPDGNLALGSYEADQFASHTHSQNSHNHNYATTRGGIQLTGGGSFTLLDPSLGNANTTTSTTATNNNTGGNETRAKSTTVNYFIRIN